MKKVFWLLPFIIFNSFAGEPVYFPAQIKQAQSPIVTVESQFDQQRMDLTLTARKRLVGWDENDRPSILPVGTSMLLQTTLDQIYNGFKKSPLADSLFRQDPMGGESMFIESADALQARNMFNQLIQLKIQQQQFDRLGIGGRLRDELTEVTVKQEGKVKKYKVDLEKASKEDAIDVGESEDIPYGLPTDYNGKDSWTVEKRTEASDIFKIKCVVCGPKKDDLRVQLENKTVNQLIAKKFANYSSDKRTKDMVTFALQHKRDPAEYAKNIDVRKCYANVKDAMIGGKMVAPNDRPAGVSPKFAGEQLTSRGFINILEDEEVGAKIKDPSQAPFGAFLVYEPVPADRLVLIKEKDKKGNLTGRKIWVPDYGHIEIKTEDVGKPGFVSDYFNTKARTGKSMESVDRKLIGIYIKPDMSK